MIAIKNIAFSLLILLCTFCIMKSAESSSPAILSEERVHQRYADELGVQLTRLADVALVPGSPASKQAFELIEKGASINSDPIKQAIIYNNTFLFEALLKGLKHQHPHDYKDRLNTCLHAACHYANKYAVATLLNEGVSPHQRTLMIRPLSFYNCDALHTPLYYAINAPEAEIDHNKWDQLWVRESIIIMLCSRNNDLDSATTATARAVMNYLCSEVLRKDPTRHLVRTGFYAKVVAILADHLQSLEQMAQR